MARKQSIDGLKLRALRDERGLSQLALEYLTQEMGTKVDERTIRRLENNESSGSSATIGILAKALKVKTEELYRDTETKNSVFVKYICDFEDFIQDRIRDFIGYSRKFVFDAIDEFVKNKNNGYFFVRGDPGIGKSTIVAQLVKEREYIHHFNIRARGINKASTFLKNICSQLIINYQLKYTALPSDVSEDDRFLSKLLFEVSDILDGKEKIVIIIDALDEVNNSTIRTGTNTLYLPPKLPDGIFVVATTRRKPLNLRIENKPGQFDIKHDSRENLDDIERYLRHKSKSAKIRSYMKRQKLTSKSFVELVTEKSQGNFMYLRYVLPEIEEGAYSDLSFAEIPVGLQNYYEDHWRRMGMMNKQPPREKIKIIYILSEVLQPVSMQLLAEFSKEDEITVQSVLDEWDQFLHRQHVEGEDRYSLYHDSFRDFLNRKKIVQAADINIKEINRIIADNLWRSLFPDEKSKKKTRQRTSRKLKTRSAKSSARSKKRKKS